MSIKEYFDKNNLHHAYLIEGAQADIVPEILKFLKSIGVSTVANPDLIQISTDSFKIDDARNLKSYVSEKGLSAGKKIFIISANNFLLEAQNSLLKIFEEPIENTHFFIITPDASVLLKTLFSRLYFISTKSNLTEEVKEAEKFIKMSPKDRIDFIKELLTEEEPEDEDENEILSVDSPRAKALKFLNALEASLHKKISKGVFDTRVFEHFFKVREFLRMPGSSPKTLMESVALITPNFSN
ncbi:MAG: hypothetical protein KGL67_02350 [Patescibacteria group bacterium]|nr:hypothetical protein [Patescibacteria group bacterium]